jgi:hypothetical protein
LREMHAPLVAHRQERVASETLGAGVARTGRRFTACGLRRREFPNRSVSDQRPLQSRRGFEG